MTAPTLRLDISMSLDGFIAGPNQTVEQPLGEGGERLHEWLFRLASFRERHGLSGGETGADTEIVEESLRATGAVVMGRRMFSGGEGDGVSLFDRLGVDPIGLQATGVIESPSVTHLRFRVT